MIFYDNNKVFSGLSTDTKPLSAIVVAGDRFYETDTNKLYEWDGTSWQLSNQSSNDNVNVEAQTLINATDSFQYGNNYNNNFANCYYNKTTNKLYFGAYISFSGNKQYGLIEADLSTQRNNPTTRFCTFDSVKADMTTPSDGIDIRGIVEIQGYLLIATRSNSFSEIKPFTDEVYGILLCIDPTTLTILWHKNFGERLTGLYAYHSVKEERNYVVLNGRMGFVAFYYILDNITKNPTNDITIGYSALQLRDIQYNSKYKGRHLETLPSTSTSTSGLSGNYKLIGTQSGYNTGQIYHCNRSGSAGNWTYTWTEMTGLIDEYPYSDNYVEKMQENHHGSWCILEEEVTTVDALPTASAEYEYTVNNRLIYKTSSNSYYYICCHNLSTQQYEWVRSYTYNYTILFISAGFGDGVHVFDLTNMSKTAYADEYGHKTRIYNWYGRDHHDQWFPFIYHNPNTGQDEEKGFHSFDAIVNYPYVYATLASDSNIVEQDKELHTNQRKMGILTLNISDLTNITATMQYIPSDKMGFYGGTDTPPNIIRRVGDYVLVNNGELGIAIFDISNDITTPQFVCNKRFHNLKNVTELCFLSDNSIVVGERRANNTGNNTVIYCGVN